METNDQAVQASWAMQKAQISQTSQAILAVSFGTSYQDSREKTIGAIEQALSGAFPEFPVYRHADCGTALSGDGSVAF